MKKSIIPSLALAAALTLSSPLITRAAEGDASTQNAAPQLVLKQDFERGDSVRDWHLQTPKGTKAYSLTLDNGANAAHSGNAALKYEVTEASEKERYVFSGAKLPASDNTEGRTLRVRFYARTAPAAEEQAFTFRVLERDEAKPTGWLGGKIDAIKIEPSAEWKEYSFTGKLASTTQGLTLYVVAKNPQVGQAVWVDDLSIEVVPTAAQ
jgi:hypothetical protein